MDDYIFRVREASNVALYISHRMMECLARSHSIPQSLIESLLSVSPFMSKFSTGIDENRNPSKVTSDPLKFSPNSIDSMQMISSAIKNSLSSDAKTTSSISSLGVSITVFNQEIHTRHSIVRFTSPISFNAQNNYRLVIQSAAGVQLSYSDFDCEINLLHPPNTKNSKLSLLSTLIQNSYSGFQKEESRRFQKSQFININETLPYECFFIAKNIPALGYSTFDVKVLDNSNEFPSKAEIEFLPWTKNESLNISNSFFDLELKGLSLPLKPNTLTVKKFDKADNLHPATIEFLMDFVTYENIGGGAYQFSANDYVPMKINKIDAFFSSRNGKARDPLLKSSLYLVFNEMYVLKYSVWDLASSFSSLYTPSGLNDALLSSSIDFDVYTPICRVDYEFALRISLPQFASAKAFIHDTNGFEIKQRHINFKDIGKNIYPMASFAAVQQDSFKYERPLQFSVFSSRTHGVRSLKIGDMHIFLQRRFSINSGKGLREKLDDTDPIVSSFRFSLMDFVVAEFMRPLQSHYFQFPPMAFFSLTQASRLYCLNSDRLVDPLCSSFQGNQRPSTALDEKEGLISSSFSPFGNLSRVSELQATSPFLRLLTFQTRLEKKEDNVKSPSVQLVQLFRVFHVYPNHSAVFASNNVVGWTEFLHLEGSPSLVSFTNDSIIPLDYPRVLSNVMSSVYKLQPQSLFPYSKGFELRTLDGIRRQRDCMLTLWNVEGKSPKQSSLIEWRRHVHDEDSDRVSARVYPLEVHTYAFSFRLSAASSTPDDAISVYPNRRREEASSLSARVFLLFSSPLSYLLLGGAVVLCGFWFVTRVWNFKQF